MGIPMSQANRIFISYSHRGDGPRWKALALRGLHVFDQHHLLDVWQDGKIRVSSYWDDDITQAMSDARIAAVLLTPEALESPYILEREFPFLRERQKRDKLPVFPVVCEPCDWRVHDWLRATQAPNGSNPVSLLPEAERDHIFDQLATDIAAQVGRVALNQLPKVDLPPAPEQMYLKKFPLTHGPGLREERLIGREQELALLDLAFAQAQTVIVSLVAWGGVGKTMLVQHWLQHLQREGWCGTQRVYAWSFYSQGTEEDRQASEDGFLTHALEWFGVNCAPTLSPWDKGRLLADAVTNEPTLLILDGIEPLQYPPGPMGGQLRAPGLQSFLKHIARQARDGERHGLCLVTTREPLTDLADFQRCQGSAWGSVLRVDLGNLTDKAGAALLHHNGANRAGPAEIKLDDKELVATGREVDGHALTLNLLGRFIARAQLGDIRRRDVVKFEEADRAVQGRTTFKMLDAFERWFAEEGDIEARALTVLRILGLFDRPAETSCLADLRRLPVIHGLTNPLFAIRHDAGNGQPTEQPLSDRAWSDAVHFLRDFGLIDLQFGPEGSGATINCHPLIREHFARQLAEYSPEAWRAAHHRLCEHLSHSAEFQPSTIETLQPLCSAIRHGCRAGEHDRVRNSIYKRRILRQTGWGRDSYFSWRILGAFSDNLSCLSCFFVQPWSIAEPSLSQSAKGWLMDEAAQQLRGLCRISEAVEAGMSGFSLLCGADSASGSVVEFVRRAVVLSELLLLNGAVERAIGTAQKGLDRVTGHGVDLATGLNLVVASADALVQMGRTEEAHGLYGMYVKTMQSQGLRHLLFCGWEGHRYSEYRAHQAERLAWSGMLTPTLSAAHGREIGPEIHEAGEALRPFLHGELPGVFNKLNVALTYLSLGRVLLLQSVLDSHRDQAADEAIAARLEVARCYLRETGYHELPRCLLTQAWCAHVRGDDAAAAEYLNEAWDIAERGPMRLHMVDIHLCRARLFFRKEHYPWKSPQDDLSAAEKLINECAYRRRVEELADAKRVILRT